MLKNITLLLLAAGLAVAAGSTYKVTLFQPSVVAGTELKPGDYKLELQGTRVAIKSGKQVVETDVKVETADTKFSTTTVRYESGEGKFKVQEIRLGGTKTRLLFN